MKKIKVLERILATIPLMLGVAILVFVFMRMLPGDPVDIMMGDSLATEAEMSMIRESMGLDEPFGSQLLSFLGGILKGDLGNSYMFNAPVKDVILRALPATIELALAAIVIALLLGVPIGILSAVKRNSWLDRITMGWAFLGISMPAFWLGLVLIILFGVNWGLLPTQGRLDHFVELKTITGIYTLDSILTGNLEAFKSSVRHLLLPGFTLGANLMAIVARVVRSSMIEVLEQDYVTLARAKGLVEWAVVTKHALRNALIPVITVVGLQVGVLLGGNMIVEQVFSWPGLGRLVVDAIYGRDYPLVQGAVMLYALTFVVANLIVDILYTNLNPKIEL